MTTWTSLPVKAFNELIMVVRLKVVKVGTGSQSRIWKAGKLLHFLLQRHVALSDGVALLLTRLSKGDVTATSFIRLWKDEDDII